MNIAVSEGAVKATMAYVYMCMAGWPLNKGVEYYKLAAAKAKEVIDGADGGSYYYKLLPEYSQVYSWEYNNKNTELLLGIYYNRDATGQSAPLTDFLQDMKQAGWGDTNGEINFWIVKMLRISRKSCLATGNYMIGGMIPILLPAR